MAFSVSHGADRRLAHGFAFGVAPAGFRRLERGFTPLLRGAPALVLGDGRHGARMRWRAFRAFLFSRSLRAGPTTTAKPRSVPGLQLGSDIG